MALLAEELVEEWARRQGLFTIRGIRLGVQEIDLLALRLTPEGLEARHIEVQASVRPVNYLTPLTKAICEERGLRPTSQVPRTPQDIASCVAEWTHRKFHHSLKSALREKLAPGATWSLELVLHRVKDESEVRELRQHVTVHRLSDVVASLGVPGMAVPAAAGTDFVDLLSIGDSKPLPD